MVERTSAVLAERLGQLVASDTVTPTSGRPAPMTRQPAVARRAEALLGTAVVATAPAAGGDISHGDQAAPLRRLDGTDEDPPGRTRPSFFEVEAAGLRWLAEAREAGGVRVPEVLAVDHECLVLRWVEPGKLTVDGASAFGAALAVTHAAGRRRTAACPAGDGAERHDGFIGRLPLPGTAGADLARSSMRPAGCCPTSSSPATAGQVDAPRTRGDRGRAAAGSASSCPRSRPRACTATCGTATWCGARRAVAGHRPRGPRRPPRDRPGDARRSSGCRTWRGCWRPTSRPRPWPRAGSRARACTSCSRCWCTRACSVAGTPPAPPASPAHAYDELRRLSRRNSPVRRRWRSSGEVATAPCGGRDCSAGAGGVEPRGTAAVAGCPPGVPPPRRRPADTNPPGWCGASP